MQPFIMCKILSLFVCYLLLMFLVLFSTTIQAQNQPASKLLLHAARVFDGDNIRTDMSVVLKDGRVATIQPRAQTITDDDTLVMDLGDATIFPGFIELHAHLTYQNVPAEIVIRHGITTIRDLGGPVHAPYGGAGSLRVLTSGPIITASGGYPIVTMGAENLAIAVADEQEARAAVKQLAGKGAVIIKIALEPGGEAGAPWTSHHLHHHGSAHPESHHPGHDNDLHHATHHSQHKQAKWPVLSESVVKAIVDEAHHHKRKVSAHVAELTGVRIALNAGVDEWAHMPCESIPEALLKQAVMQQVKIISTIDTLSKCPGITHNAAIWAALGGELLYGSEIAHPDVPWGINAQELMVMMQTAKLDSLDAVRAATSKAGRHLGMPLLGTLQPGAPADLIAFKGNPLLNLKRLEYPDLVISGGHMIVNQFGPAR
ncbi:MAG: amidohydrolase [Proteobacteria bacterium SG_bin4]|nr:MAG: amidohydrolase [Proteobacteria bacterium SG_bin4]